MITFIPLPVTRRTPALLLKIAMLEISRAFLFLTSWPFLSMVLRNICEKGKNRWWERRDLTRFLSFNMRMERFI